VFEEALDIKMNWTGGQATYPGPIINPTLLSRKLLMLIVRHPYPALKLAFYYDTDGGKRLN